MTTHDREGASNGDANRTLFMGASTASADRSWWPTHFVAFSEAQPPATYVVRS